MPFFGPPDPKKMKSNCDLKGIIKALEYRKDETVRLQAIEILRELKIPEAVEPLIVLLKEQDPIFSQTVKALGEIGGEKALKSLENRFFAGRCTEQVLQTMAKIDYEYSLKEMAAASSKYFDRSKRQIAVFGLRTLGGKQAFDALLPLVFDEDQEVAGYAADALRTFGADAIPPLISALKRWDTKESPCAKRALKHLGDEAIQPLAAALLEEGWEIKELLLDILKTLFWKPTPGSDAEIIFQILERDWEALIQHGPAAVPLLRSHWESDDIYRGEIMEVLGKIGGKEAFEALLPMLDFHGFIEDKIRADAARILGKAGWQADGISSHWIKCVNHLKC